MPHPWRVALAQMFGVAAIPDPEGPRWSQAERITIAVAGISLAVALVLVIITAGPRTLHGAAVAAPAPPMPAQPKPVSLIPPQVPDWQAAVSTTRNAAFDVPPTWQVKGPGWVYGYQIKQINIQVVFSGGAQYRDAVCGSAPSASKNSAIAGIAGSQIPDLAAAATRSAQLWAWGMFGDDSAPLPPVTLTDPAPLAVNGIPAMRVTATVSRTNCSDGRSGILHAIALPGNRGGQPVIFVVGAEQGMPGAVSDADIQKILMSIRPAGLTPAQCDQGNVVGTWC